MITIKYNNGITVNASFCRKSDHVVALSASGIPVSDSGFRTFRLDGVTQLGDFSGYRTVYRWNGDEVCYSDDGSVFVEPEPVQDPPESSEPTIEERVSSLEETNAMLLEALLEMSEEVYR